MSFLTLKGYDQLDVSSPFYKATAVGSYIHAVGSSEGIYAFSFSGGIPTEITNQPYANIDSYLAYIHSNSKIIVADGDSAGSTLYRLSFNGSAYVEEATGTWDDMDVGSNVCIDDNYVYTYQSREMVAPDYEYLACIRAYDSSLNPIITTDVPGATGDDWGYFSYDMIKGGSYIFVAAANYLLAFTFNGTTFSLGGSIAYPGGVTDSTLRLWYDGTYLYAQTSDVGSGNAGVLVYTFDGSTFDLVATLEDTIDDVWDVWTSGQYVFTVVDIGLKVYSFDGSTFTFVEYVSSDFSDIGHYTLGLSGDSQYVFISSSPSGPGNSRIWGYEYGTPTDIPVADFTSNRQAGNVPMAVDFVDQTTENPTTWYWDFGDGFTGANQNPTHTYLSPGIYTVSLEASNVSSSDTETKVDYIVAYPLTVISDFSTDTQVGVVSFNTINGIRRVTQGFHVHFTHIAIEGEAFSFLWEFGDGTTGTAPNPTHEYQAPGMYTVTLTVRDFGQVPYTVHKVNYIKVGVAEIGISPSEADAVPVGVSMSNRFVAPTGYQFSDWGWNFGFTGATSSETGPSYNYSNPGRYDVALTAKIISVSP